MTPERLRHILAANIRAERGRAHLTQTATARNMRGLGFEDWHQQTLGSIEACKRRVTAEEILGLANVFGIDAAALMALNH